MLTHKFLSLAAGLAAGGMLSVARAQETPAPAASHNAIAAKTEKPKVDTSKRAMSDPAFRRFVDLKLTMPAFHARDAGLLTDLALQLAYGESVLERPHKGFTAKDMATLALATATETGDKASLERLAKFAAKTNDSPMAASISVAKLQASKTRAVAPPIMVPMGRINYGTIDYVHGVTGGIEAAKILGSRAQLEAIIQELQKQEGLPAELRDSVLAIATDALTTLPSDATPSAAALALEKMLRAGTRQADDDDEVENGGDPGPPTGDPGQSDDFREFGPAPAPQFGGDDDDNGGEVQAQFFNNNRNRSRVRRPRPPIQVNRGPWAVQTKSLFGLDIWLEPGHAICRSALCSISQHRIGHEHTR